MFPLIFPPLRRRRLGPPAPVIRYYPVNSINGGAGNDIIITGGAVGPPGPPGPVGPPGPAGNPSPVVVTDVVTPTYAIQDTEYYLCVDHVGLATLTLPAGILGTVYIIKDCSGNALTFPITVQATGGQLIDGVAAATINTNYGSITVIFNGSEWNIV